MDEKPYTLTEEESDAWDEQIERDILAGKFDEMGAEALAEDERGETIELP